MGLEGVGDGLCVGVELGFKVSGDGDEGVNEVFRDGVADVKVDAFVNFLSD